MAAEKMRTSGTVYGSLAYDFGSPALRPESGAHVYREREIILPPRHVIDEEEASQPRHRQSVALVAILGYALAAALLILMLLVRVQLTSVTNETAAIEAEIVEMRAQNARLLIGYESAFKLSEIEKYAVHELGMQRPRQEQMYYLESFAPDKAVVLSPSGGSRSRIDRIFDNLASMAGIF